MPVPEAHPTPWGLAAPLTKAGPPCRCRWRRRPKMTTAAATKPLAVPMADAAAEVLAIATWRTRPYNATVTACKELRYWEHVTYANTQPPTRTAYCFACVPCVLSCAL
jgi:hypothetical protein